ncbi:MAG: hypothetical protein GX626_10145 [Spirochaetales bacterium]|nr:hypothetical protein [Spirochaetales bacterium]
MRTHVKTVLLIMALAGSAIPAFASQVLLNVPAASLSFTSYLDIGGGAAFIQDETPMQADLSFGLQLSPWFSLGAFVAINPLSNFEHADLGLSIADTEAAFALMSGTEFLFTASSDGLVQPFVRLALGGISVGHLENTDGIEGYDSSRADRSLFASLSVGLKMHITHHTALLLRTGWRFAGHAKTMGIQAHGLSGPELCLSVRTVWKNDINR